MKRIPLCDIEYQIRMGADQQLQKLHELYPNLIGDIKLEALVQSAYLSGINQTCVFLNGNDGAVSPYDINRAVESIEKKEN